MTSWRNVFNHFQVERRKFNKNCIREWNELNLKRNLKKGSRKRTHSNIKDQMAMFRWKRNENGEKNSKNSSNNLNFPVFLKSKKKTYYESESRDDSKYLDYSASMIDKTFIIKVSCNIPAMWRVHWSFDHELVNFSITFCLTFWIK